MTAKNRSRGRCIPARKKPYRAKYDAEYQRKAWADRIHTIATANTPINTTAAKVTLLQLEDAIEALTTVGKGTREDVSFIANEAAFVRQLCLLNFAGSGEYIDVVNEAMAALKACGERFTSTQRWGLDDKGIRALHDLVALREAQLLHPDNRVAIEHKAYVLADADIKKDNGDRFFDPVTLPLARAVQQPAHN